MPTLIGLRIKEEPNKYHDHFLDVMGSQFNFNHEKGLAEWLKNSFDAYQRVGYADTDKIVLIRFNDGGGGNPPSIECIDFVGMSHDDFLTAFKWWGDPNAAKRGMRIKTFGGHGNGGKFYMRQMFGTSHFIAYNKEGKLNVFGFNENRRYGFVEGFEDKKTSLEEAIKLAAIPEDIIPIEFLKLLREGKTGFTAVKGIRPKKVVGNRLPVHNICEKLKYHPQTRRALKYFKVPIIHNDKQVISALRMEDIEPMEGFENPFIFEIPDTFEVESGKHKTTINTFSSKFERGKLVLRTSAAPFGGRGGKRIELNCIDILGEEVIASYHMREIGFLKYYPQAQYIYGECTCPILEDPENSCVQNDREKLVDNELTRALLEWVTQRIDEVAKGIAAMEAEEEKEKDIQATDEFNKLLNNWKDQFMNKLFAEVLGGPGQGTSTGGLGLEGSGGGVRGESEEKGGLGSGAGEGGGKGTERKKGSRSPMVLLSGQEDPEVPGIPVTFSERHAPVEQRQQDVARGIYWINLDKPFAKMVIEKYGRESTQWRNYLFERYVDIFVKETIYRAARKEGGTLTPEAVDEEINKVASLVYDKASTDLEKFLLGERYSAEVEGA